MLRERLALDTSLWTTPQQATEDCASYFIENSQGLLEERINYVELYVDNDGDLAHLDFGKIKSIIKIRTEIDQLELNAVERLSKWADTNSEGVCIWISPPYPNQDEPRFMIYELEKNGDEKKVKLHAICGFQDSEHCLSIARQLSAFCPQNIDIIETEEKIREIPIPFTAEPHYPDWTYLLEELIHPHQIWETIRDGKHIQEKGKKIKISRQIVQNNYEEITNAETALDHIRIGAKMETQAEQFGLKLQQEGPCGISNSQALSLLNGVLSPFTFFHSVLPQAEKYFPCPKCKGPIPSGRGIIKCPHCGITKEEAGSKCG